MTLKEFNTFLEEGTTNEMFESLVLYHIQDDNYMIKGCNTNSQGDKIYAIQDSWVGNEYYLILDFLNKVKETDYPQDKYMIAKKDLKTIYFLVNRLAIYSDKNIPANCRCISYIVKQAGLGNSKFLDSKGNDFTKHIDNIVAEQYKQFKSANERLYYKFTDKMIDRLLEDKYISEAKDWNRKTGKIKLSGSSGKDRICKSHFHSGVGYVTFNIDKPYDHILEYLTEEKDIDVLVEKILKMLKNK
jgi:hypothetical protein